MSSSMAKVIFVVLTVLSSSCYAQLSCYSCGLASVDPIADGQNYSTDPRNLQSKMYNETCEKFETMIQTYPNAVAKWIRPCPAGVQDCFWAQGSYGRQSPRFRGCSGTQYPQINGCYSEVQAVTLVMNKTSADVKVGLCYCSSDKCNMDGNGSTPASILPQSMLYFISVLIIFGTTSR